MTEIEKNEKEKYTQAWKTGAENNSRTSLYLTPYLKDRINQNWKILDLGCGNGINVELLRNCGIKDIYGVDITLEGLNLNHKINTFGNKINDFCPWIQYYIQAPLWKLPFLDNEFDFTYSVDVLEHIPSKLIKKTIDEILRITKVSTFHCIATFPDRGFHLSVQSIDIWKNIFFNQNNKKINIEIIDRTEFLKNTIPNYQGK